MMSAMPEYERMLTVVQSGPVTWVMIDMRGEVRGHKTGKRGFERIAAYAARWMADVAQGVGR